MTRYFAYGSNLDLRRFFQRCPEAKTICRGWLYGWRLRFAGAGHADIVRSHPSHYVPGALYLVNDEDMSALDRYEGTPKDNSKRGYYYRAPVRVETVEHGVVEAIAYVMTPGRALAEPSELYLLTVVRGLREWGLEAAPAIRRALKEVCYA